MFEPLDSYFYSLILYNNYKTKFRKNFIQPKNYKKDLILTCAKTPS